MLRVRFVVCTLLAVTSGCQRATVSPAVVVARPAEAAEAEAGPTAFTLPNGLRVRLVPAHDEKKAVVLLGVRAGFFDEPAGVPHVAHVTEHLAVFGLREGTEEARAVARWYGKGQANAETMADFMYFDLHVAPEEVPLAVRVQAARLAGPEYTHEVLAREVPRTLAEIDFLEKSAQGGTGKFALCPFVQAALHKQTDVPVKAKTRQITLDHVREFTRKTFRPDRAILVVIGDFDSATVRPVIEQAFGPIPRPQSPPLPRPALTPGAQSVKWDASTRHVLLAWPAPPVEDPAHPALTVASFALMARLYMDAELKPLVKHPLVSNEVEGTFFLNAQVQPGAELDAVRDKLLERVAQLEKANVFELTQAKMGLAQLTAPVNLDAMQLPPHVSRMMARANMELQKLSRELLWGDLAAYVTRVRAVDAAAVRAAVTKHLDPKSATVVRLAP